MRDYTDYLMDLEQLEASPPFCWVHDLANEELSLAEALGFDIGSTGSNSECTHRGENATPTVP